MLGEMLGSLPVDLAQFLLEKIGDYFMDLPDSSFQGNAGMEEHVGNAKNAGKAETMLYLGCQVVGSLLGLPFFHKSFVQ